MLAAPLEVAANALAERGVGPPAELAQSALARDLLAAEVPGPSLGVDDLDVAEEIANRLCDLEDRGGLVAGQVVDTVGRLRPERGDDAPRQVLDVDEPPALAAVARNREGLARECALDHRGHDRRDSRAGAVRDAEAQDRVLEAVELGVGAAVELAG